MKLTEEQATTLITNVALASIHHSEDLALVDEGRTAFAELAWVMEAVADADLTDEDRGTLRILCGRAITDPTTYRGDLVDQVLAAIPEEAARSSER